MVCCTDGEVCDSGSCKDPFAEKKEASFVNVQLQSSMCSGDLTCRDGTCTCDSGFDNTGRTHTYCPSTPTHTQTRCCSCNRCRSGTGRRQGKGSTGGTLQFWFYVKNEKIFIWSFFSIFYVFCWKNEKKYKSNLTQNIQNHKKSKFTAAWG